MKVKAVMIVKGGGDSDTDNEGNGDGDGDIANTRHIHARFHLMKARAGHQFQIWKLESQLGSNALIGRGGGRSQGGGGGGVRVWLVSRPSFDTARVRVSDVFVSCLLFPLTFGKVAVTKRNCVARTSCCSC